MTAENQGVGQYNARGYAHDAAIVTESLTSMSHFLDDIFATLCDSTGMDFDTGKTQIAGIDHKAGKVLSRDNTRCKLTQQ